MRKGLWITVLVLVLAAILVVSEIVYVEHFRVVAMDTKSSPDGRFRVTLCQIGTPGYLFGSVNARIILKGPDGQELERIETFLCNDGGGILPEHNWEVEWSEAYIEITLHHADKPDENSYRIPLY